MAAGGGRSAVGGINFASAGLLTIALIARLISRGGPYFEGPLTIVDHVAPQPHETRDALLLLPKVTPMIPRGAFVTCFRPEKGQQHFDLPNYFTAVGGLPRQTVLPPFVASRSAPRQKLVEWVIAVRDPFTHPGYDLVAAFPEGRLYRVKP
jgi:hypothetical protein